MVTGLFSKNAQHFAACLVFVLQIFSYSYLTVIEINLLGALSLIRYCLTPDASNRATTKDILRHDWLVHGPVLSLRLNSATKPTQPITSSSLSLTDPSTTVRDHDKVHYRSSVTPTTTTTYNDKSISPTNSLLELELHTSSFFDTTKLRDNHSTTKDRQRPNRASAVIPDSTRFYSSNHSKANPSSQNPHRRPLSLSLDNQQSNNPNDYHFALTSEKPARISSPKSAVTAPTYTRRARRTVSPASNYENRERYQSPTNRYTIAASPEATRRTTSPVSPSRYIVSYDFDKTLRDLKRKPIYKYIPPSTPPTTTNELNVVPSLLNSTTPVAPSVFTTSSIKFAPVPTRRTSPLKDHEPNLISSTRLSHNYNTIIPNSSSNPDDSITKSSAYTNPNNRRSLLNSYDLPSSTSPPPLSSSSIAPNLRKSRLLDDNNNFISLKVHD